MNGFAIETPRLRLRPWREEDKPAFHDIINTPAMMRWFGGVAPRAAIDALIDGQIAAQAKHGRSMWAVELHDGELVGICGVRRCEALPGTPVDGLLEIGWRVAEPFWGTGVAREAAEASLAWAWGNTADPFVAGWTNPPNERSLGLMRKLGMRRRPELDFAHPRYEPGDPLGAMLVHAAERPR